MAQKNNKRNLSFWIPAKHNKIHVPKEKTRLATFQGSLRVTVIIGQIFSLMPFVGAFSSNAKDVKFVKTSWKCLYALLSLFGQCFMAVMCINKMMNSSSTLMGTSPLIFYISTCITMVMFTHAAQNWPPLVQAIAKTEELDPNYDVTLPRRCNVTCAVVLFLALVEHVLSLLSAVAGAEICYPNLPTYEGFVKHFYPWVFNSLPYTQILGLVTQYKCFVPRTDYSLLIAASLQGAYPAVLLSKLPPKFLHFQSTFIWNFSDLFVICMSYYLTSRLGQVNKKLLAAQGKYLPEVFWRNTREEYGRATHLVRKVDDVISGIVFISFANNLFFICLQLFNTLEDGIKGTGECSSREKKTTILGGYEAAVYFIFSLVYLITRSVAVSLIASQVNTASDVPAPVLYDVPSPVYCVEVQRFLDQVNGDHIALSGLQFFTVTRGLLLTVAGTIVTYELVMFQFNSAAPDDSTLTNVSTTVATSTLSH